MKKKQVSSYLTEEEARILKESAYTQTDLLRQDIIQMAMTDNDYYMKLTVSETVIKIIDDIINNLNKIRDKHQVLINDYEEQLSSFHCDETEDASNAVETFNNVLRVNHDKRYVSGVSGFGMNKIPLSVAMSIARDGNINLRALLSKSDEKLMRNELEGYSTLLKRWKVKTMNELRK